MFRKKYILLLIIFIVTIQLYGNEITIKSFKPITNLQINKIDFLGETCALLKVKPNFDDELQFDAGKKLAHPYEKNAKGEYWIYLSPGEEYLEIYHQDTLIEKMVFFKNQIKSNVIYELILYSEKLSNTYINKR